MIEDDIHLLEELDNISKIRFEEQMNIDHLVIDFTKTILPMLKIERMNVWLFNQEKTELVSISEYDLRTNQFHKSSILKQTQFPVYFEGLQQNKIIHAEDIHSHPLTKEFNSIYSRPNDIHSLLDIPIRISGNLIGVMCFEKTGAKKRFTINEQSLCLSASYVLSSILENKYRLLAQFKLEETVKEKQVLINELNHRVKNNFSILIGLLHLSKEKVKTQEAKELLLEYEQRIFSMLKIHEMLNQSANHTSINFSKYLKELINEFRVSFPQFNHCVSAKINEYEHQLSSKMVLNLGLIITEILINSIKHAAQQTPHYELTVELIAINKNTLQLLIGDNGAGFDFEKESSKNSLGLSLIKDLSTSNGLQVKYPRLKNAYYNFVFTF